MENIVHLEDRRLTLIPEVPSLVCPSIFMSLFCIPRQVRLRLKKNERYFFKVAGSCAKIPPSNRLSVVIGNGKILKS